jgi:hypothetical protein
MSLIHPPLPPDDAPFDDDNPEWTEEDFARAKGPETLPPEVLAAFPKTAARVQRLREAGLIPSPPAPEADGSAPPDHQSPPRSDAA